MKINSKGWALLTDLYELTMAACYFENEMDQPATFSLFIRSYPPGRNFFVAAGLADALNYLENLRFTPEDLSSLERTGLFKPAFLEYLKNFRFTGEVWAIPEGRLFFAEEPLLEVRAPLIEAQLVETYLINTLNLQVMIATKAARCVAAAQGRPLVDFSLRRTQGRDAGLKVARASYITGFIGTSNVLAGKEYNIPIYGTMAHSFVVSFPSELAAFRAFAQTFPENTIFLVDTYDSLAGVRKAVKVGRELKKAGIPLKGIRLDSGDIVRLSQAARRILDEAGFKETMIFASGAFDEYKIQQILAKGAEVNSFGVGTKMGVSGDAPYLDMAYKLVQYNGRPVLKLSPGKMTLAGEKQVFRFYNQEGHMAKDILGLRWEQFERGELLLERFMSQGKITKALPSLVEIRERFLGEFATLDASYKEISSHPPRFPVDYSPALRKLQQETIREVREKELGES